MIISVFVGKLKAMSANYDSSLTNDIPQPAWNWFSSLCMNLCCTTEQRCKDQLYNHYSIQMLTVIYTNFSLPVRAAWLTIQRSLTDEAEARFYQVCEQLVMGLVSSSCKHCCIWSFNHGFPRDWGSSEVRRLSKESYRCCRSPEFPCDCDVVHAKFPAGSLGKVLRVGSS